MKSNSIFKYLWIVFILTGCAQENKNSLTKFEPIGSSNGVQEFRFMAKSGIFKAPDDPESEKERLMWLQMWLSDNKMCSNGFSIISRNAVSLGPGYYDSVKNIYYTGRCK